MQEVLLKTEVFPLFLTQGQEMTILMVTTWSKKKEREREIRRGIWFMEICILYIIYNLRIILLRIKTRRIVNQYILFLNWPFLPVFLELIRLYSRD